MNWIGNKKLPKSELKDIFISFELDTFFKFLDKIRTLYFASNVFELIKKYNDDIWSGYELVSFLLDKGIVRIKNKKLVFEKNFNSFFIKPLNEKEVLKKLKSLINYKLDLNKPLLYNFNPSSKFKWKAKYDQIPITTKSAIKIISKISYYFPAKLKFIFVGDDDFLSIPLKMILDIPTFSLDKDKNLLSEVEKLSKKFNLDIHTIEADVRMRKDLGGFYGCYINPPYNISGSKTFLEFSSRLLTNEGGMVFMVLGDDALGKRYIHLQKIISDLGFLTSSPLRRGSSHLFVITSVICEAVGVVRDPPILDKAFFSMFNIAMLSLSASKPHFEHFITLCLFSFNLLSHIGQMLDVPLGSITITGTPCFSACQSIQNSSFL